MTTAFDVELPDKGNLLFLLLPDRSVITSLDSASLSLEAEDNLFKFSELNDFALCNLNFLLDFILKADWGELFLDLFKDKGDFVGVAASLLLNDGAFVHINKRIFRKNFFK